MTNSVVDENSWINLNIEIYIIKDQRCSHAEAPFCRRVVAVAS